MKTFKIIFAIILIFSLGCSSNILTSLATTDTDEALLFEAKSSLDQQKYNDAISFISLMSAAGQASEETIVVHASALAGNCGFDFLSFVENISQSGGSSLFLLLFGTMTSSDATKVANCAASMTKIEELSTEATARGTNENLMMTLVSLASLGSILNANGDTDANGSVDASFDHCTTIPDNEVNVAVASFARMLDSIGQISASSFEAISVSDIQAACTAIGALGSNFDICSAKDPTAVTADQRRAMRAIIGDGSSGIGLGQSTSSCTNLADCLASCP